MKATVVAPVALCGALAACGGGDAGPAAVTDGTYSLMAVSAGGAPTSPRPSLTIAGNTVQISTSTGPVQATSTPTSTTYTLCPPNGKGAPLALSTPVTVNGTLYVRPALFGDCGVTKPVRVTLIDLDSTTSTSALPFSRWAEFCYTTDPDCKR